MLIIWNGFNLKVSVVHGGLFETTGLPTKNETSEKIVQNSKSETKNQASNLSL